MIVIGVGNEFRRDDGAGPAVVERLRGRCSPRVTLAVCDGEPTRLIDLWTGADVAVVVDAVRSVPAEPGRVRELDARSDGDRGAGGHDPGLGTAVRLGETLGRMPRRLVVYAIEGADFGPGAGLCPPVERAVEEVAGRIAELAGHAAPPGAPTS